MKSILKNARLLYSIRHAEHYDTHEAICEAVESLNTEIPRLESFLNIYKSSFEQESNYFGISLRKEFTPNLKEVDAARDDTYMYLKRTVEYKQYSRDENEKAAADKLKIILDNYKHTKTAYTKNSVQITKLLEDLRKDENSGAVSLLNLTTVVDKLDTQNERFKEISQQRSQNMFLLNEESMDRARRNTDRAFMDLADCINAIYITNELTEKDETIKETLGKVIDFINAYIDQAGRNYSRRVKRCKPDTSDPSKKPHLTFTNLVVFSSEVPNSEGIGNKFSLEAEDPEAFRKALYPDGAVGGMIVYDTNPDYPFPVEDYLVSETDSSIAIGLIMDPYDTESWFFAPDDNTKIISGKLVKEGKILAIIDAMPETNFMKLEVSKTTGT
ncbi:hypothetical protein M2459_000125 [Parabacteroides sp. PF5-5]|uniref:DUF6261 family protein n=1 Tax=unclassified Parabacteroides TaxID=2649774 RepID=UPI0024735602|nr:MULTISPECIES: DUF6261 family protein [unclassified Parabacteroides]MDH6303793.1 hypothetical protein [Parabacteroides sp. PH5-39]MDH6314410.1 hypothetical protein [Parabacteroides sp. PF5-13]MDH6318525.1 hypothetical protein [Parabacteroides sp. PH5-13]MDH6322182.1 hypothetical protein [Parabacteroides sp. PH5-8]MDH6325738.1 hypothetical protein [Parabacteroides sp. PH5-41]